jgi:hypothetical protein
MWSNSTKALRAACNLAKVNSHAAPSDSSGPFTRQQRHRSRAVESLA